LSINSEQHDAPVLCGVNVFIPHPTYYLVLAMTEPCPMISVRIVVQIVVQILVEF
jgi:hypothetical protein